ncbi:hypothetical protein [Pseudonocardia xinjiangensis]|uniref:Uncharacterized protein n=1 Tax=Pseudonocardia xinjiangensis TaxID=75289 RepID=A0ABX1RE10_9PSEU|nr:hypothetical protein [Pseudonocardia xinjiangensis]NMH77468.1 hypothetical protein [Pseudonocardia xinjiangensis]
MLQFSFVTGVAVFGTIYQGTGRIANLRERINDGQLSSRGVNVLETRPLCTMNVQLVNPRVVRWCCCSE